MLLYDELGGHKGLRRHRHLTRRKALRIAPALKPDALIGAIQYWDAQVDDARHTLDHRAHRGRLRRRGRQQRGGRRRS